MKKAILPFLLLCFITKSIQKSTPEDDHYVAAVLEYHHDSSTAANLQNYVDFIRQAAEQNADIVVFPEMTLTRGTAVVVPINGLLKDFPTPALRPDLYDDVLVQLSQAAREHQIYVVVNVQEEMDCSTDSSAPGELCPVQQDEQQVYRFNTNVVFDRIGSVIDRYRKINLFGEYSRTPALQDDLGVFSTDFGVTFGHFICFDLMFQVPAIQVVQKLNVTDVIFTTMWFSEMPFLTAVEIQEAYAYANDINFLASGASNVAVGSAGSGIFSGKAGALISTMPGVNTRMMLVSKVPKVPGKVEGITYPGAIPNDPKVQDDLQLKRDMSLPAHVTRVIRETEDLQEFVLENGDVTCSFKIQLRDLQAAGDQGYYKYRAMAINEVKTIVQRTIGLSGCAVISCLTDDVKTCAIRSSNTTSKYEISTLEVSMTSPKPTLNQTTECNDAFYYPISLKTDKYPLSSDNFTYQVEEVKNNSIYHEEKDHGRQKVTTSLIKPQKEIMTFGVHARIYSKDINRRGEEIDEEAKRQFEEFEDSL